MTFAVKLSLTASGVFFLTGLLTGVWKFRHMATRADRRAPVYVDIAHRASLMYSFASLVLARFAELSPFGPALTAVAAAGPLLFFAIAIANYLVLGARDETENQFELRSFTTTWGMWALVVTEIAGFAVLFAGLLLRLWCELEWRSRVPL